MENVRDIVARNVRLARQEAGLSQEDLAEAAGIDLSYEGRIERGTANPSVEVIAKLARVLKVRPGSLLEAGPGGRATGPKR